MTISDNSYSAFDPALLRHAAARFVKLLARARWKGEPGFLDPTGLAAWGLQGISRDRAPAHALAQQAADALERISVDYLPPCASGGVPADWDCSTPVGRVQDGIICFVKYDCASTDISRPFRDATALLNDGKPVDWPGLADWALLPNLRAGLDALPQPGRQEAPSGLEAIEKKLGGLDDLLRRKQGAPEREWFSIEEVADMTGLSADHVRRHVTSGSLPVSNQGTFAKPYYRIRRSDVDAWMSQRMQKPGPAPRKKAAPGPYVSRHHRKADG